MGSPPDDVDVRGRWKGRLAGRIVGVYISPDQPYIDAKVAANLCGGCPIAYELHPELKDVVTKEWLLDHVVPAMNTWYGVTDNPSLTLALPLLWASFDEGHQERQVPHQRERIRAAFESIRPDGFEGNPVVKTHLTIGGVGLSCTSPRLSLAEVLHCHLLLQFLWPWEYL